jgi:hypothetical protein
VAAAVATATQNQGSNNNGGGGARNRNTKLLLDGSVLGKCFYAKCTNKEILRNHSGAGEGVSYHVCSNACGKVCVHDACLEKWCLEQGDQIGTQIQRPCNKCGQALTINTEVAVFRAIWFWFLGWPWFLLSRVLPLITIAGFVLKLWIYMWTVCGHEMVPWRANPQFVTIGNRTTGDIKIHWPHWNNANFSSFNFCKPSSFEYACFLFNTGCEGWVYCSRGGWSVIRLYKLTFFRFFPLPFPVPFLEEGHFWMGVYFLIFVYGPYWLLFEKTNIAQGIWTRLSRRFRVRRVRSVQVALDVDRRFH